MPPYFKISDRSLVGYRKRNNEELQTWKSWFSGGGPWLYCVKVNLDSQDVRREGSWLHSREDYGNGNAELRWSHQSDFSCGNDGACNRKPAQECGWNLEARQNRTSALQGENQRNHDSQISWRDISDFGGASSYAFHNEIYQVRLGILKKSNLRRRGQSLLFLWGDREENIELKTLAHVLGVCLTVIYL